MSEAMYIKFPATNTNAYCLAPGDKSFEFRPMYTPTSDIRLTTPLLRIVSFSLKRLFKRMATSPIYLGISWAIIPTVIGIN